MVNAAHRVSPRYQSGGRENGGQKCCWKCNYGTNPLAAAEKEPVSLFLASPAELMQMRTCEVRAANTSKLDGLTKEGINNVQKEKTEKKGVRKKKSSSREGKEEGEPGLKVWHL